MSFKDVKDLAEHLKLIGYPKNIQLSIFCTNYGGPSAFSVVVEILRWLINRLEPSSTGNSFISDINIDHEIKTEHERVQFIRAVTEFLITKCGIKINPRKLYSSSFSSAKEILKITNLLLNAPQNANYVENLVQSNDMDGDEDEMSLKNLSDFSESKISELRKARELSSDLTNHGAILYDLLKKEITNKNIRNAHANRSIEISTIERTLKNSISQLENNLKINRERLEQLKSDKNNITSKVDRKLSELERSKHRLDALKKVRPAYLDEFTKFEDELKELYSLYALRVRCIDSLKSQLSNTSNQRSPTPTNIPIIRPSENIMNDILLNDEDGLLGSDDSDEDDDDDDDAEEDLVDKKIDSKINRITSRSVLQAHNEDRSKKRVTMKDGNHSDDIELDSTFNSDESDSVLAELGADNLMDIPEEHSYSNLTRDPPIGAQSDEDF